MNPSGIDASRSVVHRSSGTPRRMHLQRYGLAVLSVAVALGAALLCSISISATLRVRCCFLRSPQLPGTEGQALRGWRSSCP